MYGDHVHCPLHSRLVPRHPGTVVAVERADKPHHAVMEDAGQVGPRLCATSRFSGHNVSLRHLTSSDVYNRFRR
jgi:hypothetical protein